MTKVFIDGSSGTTGLRIHDRLRDGSGFEIIRLSEESRKDPEARKKAINESDVTFLCLPDAASIEAVSFVDNDDTVIIDTSTAHRTNDAWAYGFPELEGYRPKIKTSKRIANPGCHASGFIALVEPLVRRGVLSKEAELTAFSLTGYSGGGKKMIAEYESEGRNPLLDAPRQYGITQMHKHLPEMSKVCGLTHAPVFCPIVADYYSGMEVTVPLFAGQVDATPEEIKEIYASYYVEGLVSSDDVAEDGFMSGSSMTGRDTMKLSVQGNDERILLISRFDNLGKGASGAAIQNMNISLGLDDSTGLVL